MDAEASASTAIPLDCGAEAVSASFCGVAQAVTVIAVKADTISAANFFSVHKTYPPLLLLFAVMTALLHKAAAPRRMYS